MEVKITGAAMVRETSTMALINNNDSEKNEYFSKLKLIQNQKEGLNKVNEEINDLRRDMDEVKNLLLQLLQNNKSTKE